MIGPALAVADQAVGAGAPELTLKNFQSIYSGDKPVVQWNKYQEYRYTLRHPAPQTTLNVSSMRSDAIGPVAGFRNKPNAEIQAQAIEAQLAKGATSGGSYSPSTANLKPGRLD